MLAKMEIISKEFIKPSSPTTMDSKKGVKLSFLDQIAPPNFVPLIFFYQKHESSNVDNSQRCQHLKQSLSESLTRFYPLAGRINNTNLSFIDCDDSGALFIEAQVHAQLSEKLSQSAAIEELNQYLPLEPYAHDADDIPLAIQISFFECGGIAIGVCISHKVADAMSFVTFMTAWAATNRREAEGTLPPSFDLTGHLFPQLNFKISSSLQLVKNEKMVTKRLVFNKEKLAALKELASSTAIGSLVKGPTRVEAVSSFIRKHFIGLTKAKADNTKQTFAAYHTVNLRTRMSLPAFDHICAFGNLFVTTSALSVSDKNQELHDLVWHLRTAFTKVNDEYINHVQSGMPYLNTLSNEMKPLFEEDMGSCCFSSWCGFPVYEVDYGWGKPVVVCTSAVPMSNVVILMSTRCGDGIEAWINMLEDEIAMLPEEILSLATDHLLSCP